jgi:hypothetical protein
MVGRHWVDSSGNWTTMADWSGDTVPGPMDGAIIDATGSYTVSENTSSRADQCRLDRDQHRHRLLAITDVADNKVGAGGVTNSGTFGLHDSATLTITSDFSNSGALDVDNVDNATAAIEEGGSSLTITGTLANTSTVQIGNPALSAPTTVTLGGLTNPTGASFALNGSSSHAATLAFSGTGSGFTSNGGKFELTYAAPLTLGAAFTNNSGGTFGLHYDTALTVDGGFANGGALDVDNVDTLPRPSRRAAAA